MEEVTKQDLVEHVNHVGTLGLWLWWIDFACRAGSLVSLTVKSHVRGSMRTPMPPIMMHLMSVFLCVCVCVSGFSRQEPLRELVLNYIIASFGHPPPNCFPKLAFEATFLAPKSPEFSKSVLPLENTHEINLDLFLEGGGWCSRSTVVHKIITYITIMYVIIFLAGLQLQLHKNCREKSFLVVPLFPMVKTHQLQLHK